MTKTLKAILATGDTTQLLAVLIVTTCPVQRAAIVSKLGGAL
jgi:hypothetical protein